MKVAEAVAESAAEAVAESAAEAVAESAVVAPEMAEVAAESATEVGMVPDLVVWVRSMETAEGSGGRVVEAVEGEGRPVGSRGGV